jgi:hypothetical protein
MEFLQDQGAAMGTTLTIPTLRALIGREVAHKGGGIGYVASLSTKGPVGVGLPRKAAPLSDRESDYRIALRAETQPGSDAQ